jgi:hypothetical protein
MEERSMKNTACMLLIALFLANTPVAAYRIADVDIPDSVQLVNSDTRLVLNGTGIRKKFFKDIYIGALYLPEKTSDAGAILGATGPASVLLHFLYKEVSKEKITNGWNDGLEANTSAAEMTALKPDLEKFNSLFLTVRKGDVIRIDYQPGTGTEVRINGKWRGTVESETFFRSLLKIWLGSSPVGKDLKSGMLGAD